jgi:hypothetical protein
MFNLQNAWLIGKILIMIPKNTVVETIKLRKSCRTYSERAINPDVRKGISEYFSKQQTGPFKNTIKLCLIENAYGGTYKDLKLGTYGMIKGANNFVAGVVGRGERYLEDYGYIFEKMILYLTDLGLDTCWLGGLFVSRKEFAKAVNLKEGETIPAITPVGYRADKASFADKLIRLNVGSNSRKSWNKLFFDKTFDTPLDKESAGGYVTALEMVRLAPSGSNRQPWRIIKERDKDIFHFFLMRNKVSDQIYKEIDLQKIDMGIAMCHFELTAGELNLKGRWDIKQPEVKPPEGMEYIVSWVPAA